MIYLQLQDISGNPDIIGLKRETITTWYLWEIPVEIPNEPHPTWQQSLKLWDQIHTTNPALALRYLSVLSNLITVDRNQVVGPGTEQVMRVASLCLLRVLSIADPEVLEDLCQRYKAVIPHDVDFNDLRCYHAINAVRTLFITKQECRPFEWIDYKPCPQEHAFFANTLVQDVRKARDHQENLPDWIFSFVHHSLSLEPPPPASVTVDCLLILAINLGYNISSTGTIILDERYIHTY